MTTDTETFIIACPRCGQKNRIPRGRPGAVCGRCGASLEPGAARAPEATGDGRPVVVTDANYAQEVLRSPLPVVLDCWAAWCGPCRSIAPSVDRLARSYAGRVKVGKLDVDANPRTAQMLGIQAMPTVLYVIGGRVVDRLVGAHPYETLEAKLRQVHLPSGDGR
jgi:thioredoxin